MSRRRKRDDLPGAWNAFRQFPRLLPYVRPHWRLATVSASLIAASIVIGLAAPWPLAFVIDNVIGDKVLPGVLDGVLGGLSTYLRLVVLVSGGLLLTALAYGLGIIDNYANTKLNLLLVLDFRGALYAHVQRLSPMFHDRVPAGQVMYRLNQQANAVGAIVIGLPPLAQSLLTVMSMFTIAALLDWQLALIAIAVVPLIVYSAQYYTRRIEPQLYEVRNLEARVQSTMYEAVAMLRVVLAFGRERDEHRRWREQAKLSNDARLRLTVRQTIFSLVIGTITATGTALVLGFGARSVIRGDLTLGELTVFLGYVAAMYQPMQQMSASLASLQQQFVNFDTALELLRIPPEIEDAPEAIEAMNVKGAIGFDGVHFDYSPAPASRAESESRNDESGLAPAVRVVRPAAREFLDDPVIAELCSRARTLGLGVDELISGRGRRALANISFEVAVGQHVAIVGPTGAGKTTLMNLIVRFYDPTRGTIRLDGVDIRRFRVASLRDQVSIVLQEPMLFAGSIGDNIRYGRPAAGDEDVVKAAKAANVDGFISGLPDGYDTIIGERGSQLSGGERQRISVARAFLKDAPMLILDEPTSSIDSRTEAVVLAALERLMEGRTTFTVAHRLSTVRRADLIVVLDRGRVAAIGEHDSLLAAGGLYAQLHQAQTGTGSAEAFAADARDTADATTPMSRVFARLLVAAVTDLLETGSPSRLGVLIGRMPARLRFPPWWLLIGAVFAVLRDDSDLPLRRLAHRVVGTEHPQGRAIGYLAAHLLEDGDILHRIHARLRDSGALSDAQPLVPEGLLSEPWAELGTAYPEASRMLSEVLPTKEGGRRAIPRP